jgi:two-component system NtrC family sensor kinase
MMYEQRLDRVRRAVVRCGTSESLLREVREGGVDRLAPVLASLREDNGLDFAGFVDRHARWVTSTGGPGPAPEDGPYAALLRAAVSGQTVACTLVLDRATLAREGSHLVAQARLRVRGGSRSRPPASEWIEDGLVQFSAAPVRAGRSLVGVAYGGVLLNRNTEIVDQVKRAVFGNELFRGKPVGAASIFLGDVRISSFERVDGTQVAAEVAEQVLDRAEPWLGRTVVIDAPFVTAYEPIRDQDGRVVGMLGIGVQEDAYLALRTRVMLTFLIVAVAGVVIVLGLTYVLARAVVRPLATMAAATRRIAAGDLDHKVPITSGDEVGVLAQSFNAMVDSLRVARDELEGWAQTLEDKVQERTAELVHVQSKMAEADRLASLGRMAAGVAHEINNPMGGILTFASLGLQDLPDDHPQRRNFEIIIKQTMRCRDIVRGLLEFSRQTEATPTPTDVDDVIDKTLALLQQQASFQNVRTHRIAADDLPRILIDPGHLQQVVLNLLVNAVDAMEEKGDLTVRTGLSSDGRDILIHVQDTGKGIPKDVLPMIFEPFFTTKEVGRGTGLGLAIVHGIVTRAHGRVEVGTSPSGTTFTVSLPVARDGS